MSQFDLIREDGILKLYKTSSREKIEVNFLDSQFLFRLKTLSKNQPLFKAVHIQKGLKLLDATAGLGRDTVGFAYLGADVTAIEENSMIYALLEDGVHRLLENQAWAKKIGNRLRVVHASSLDYMKALKEEQKPDVIYLDPMYPEKEKSAKPKKEMLFLRELLNPTQNIEELLEISLKTAKDRVVLKRPLDADFLIRKPNHSYKSKMVRFDMYVISHRTTT